MYIWSAKIIFHTRSEDIKLQKYFSPFAGRVFNPFSPDGVCNNVPSIPASKGFGRGYKPRPATRNPARQRESPSGNDFHLLLFIFSDYNGFRGGLPVLQICRPYGAWFGASPKSVIISIFSPFTAEHSSPEKDIYISDPSLFLKPRRIRFQSPQRDFSKFFPSSR